MIIHLNEIFLSLKTCFDNFCYNLVQNIVDKFTQLNEIDFSMESFAVNFFQHSALTLEICLMGGGLGTCHHFQAFQGFSGNFRIS